MLRPLLRPARPDDIPQLLELLAELAGYEHLGHALQTDAQRLHQHLFGARPYAEALVAEVDARIVGLTLFFHTYAALRGQPGLHVEVLFVLPAARGQGVGRALLTALARLALERECGRLEWPVLDWNEPALDFYRRLNAQPQDDWTLHHLSGEALLSLARHG
ncbi:MAG: Acetyltransferase YpeA [Stenotrophomonas maltophilia]|nr:MAG: Acetyltransferase YpeA [Stenotrophomonas maltophilia]